MFCCTVFCNSLVFRFIFMFIFFHISSSAIVFNIHFWLIVRKTNPVHMRPQQRACLNLLFISFVIILGLLCYIYSFIHSFILIYKTHHPCFLSRRPDQPSDRTFTPWRQAQYWMYCNGATQSLGLTGAVNCIISKLGPIRNIFNLQQISFAAMRSR